MLWYNLNMVPLYVRRLVQACIFIPLLYVWYMQLDIANIHTIVYKEYTDGTVAYYDNNGNTMVPENDNRVLKTEPEEEYGAHGLTNNTPTMYSSMHDTNSRLDNQTSKSEESLPRIPQEAGHNNVQDHSQNDDTTKHKDREGDIADKGYSTYVYDIPRKYTPPPAANISTDGRDFNVSEALLQGLGIPPRSYLELSRDTMETFVFVTGCDRQHFEESTDAIASLHRHFPNRTILYYDLGLDDRQIPKLKSWCGVLYRKFDFNIYPPHVRNLFNMAFKMMIIREVLDDYGALFWFDASFRAMDSNWTSLYVQALENGGISMALGAGKYSNFAMTDPSLYEFIPTNPEKQKSVSMGGGGALLVYNTWILFTEVLVWIYLCFLDCECAEPRVTAKRIRPRYANSTTKFYLGMHRYDQSVLGVVLSNRHGYSTEAYMPSEVHIDIHKWPTNKYNLEYC